MENRTLEASEIFDDFDLKTKHESAKPVVKDQMTVQSWLFWQKLSTLDNSYGNIFNWLRFLKFLYLKKNVFASIMAIIAIKIDINLSTNA